MAIASSPPRTGKGRGALTTCTATGDEWLCLEAVTTPEPNGHRLSTSRPFERRGPIGVAVQGLPLARR
jgi:hypothetical protein